MIVSNEDLQKEFPDWDIERLSEKTGVYNRHIAGVNETAFDLSVRACEKLFETIDHREIDGIIFCTQSPDFIMPPNSFLLHKHFGFADNVFAFDFNHACTGYIYCLAMANAFLKAGMGTKILIINSDTYSKYINNRDRSTRALFGDGAAATVVKNSKGRIGIIDVDLRSNGSNYDKFWIPVGGLRLPRTKDNSIDFEDDKGRIRSKDKIEMDGLGVWSFINAVAPKQVNRLLHSNDIDITDIDQFVFHQASRMTLNSVMRSLKLNEDKVMVNIQNIGNTVSASIPIALKNALDQKKIKNGSLVVLSGFGVGLSYGAILMEY